MVTLISILIALAILAIVVWVAKAVLAQVQAPPVVFVIVTAIACLILLAWLASLLGAPLPFR